MNTDQKENCCSTPKPGFFRRLIERLDRAMKAKAEKAENCCGPKDGNGKGGKCC